MDKRSLINNKWKLSFESTAKNNDCGQVITFWQGVLKNRRPPNRVPTKLVFAFFKVANVEFFRMLSAFRKVRKPNFGWTVSWFPPKSGIYIAHRMCVFKTTLPTKKMEYLQYLASFFFVLSKSSESYSWSIPHHSRAKLRELGGVREFLIAAWCNYSSSEDGRVACNKMKAFWFSCPSSNVCTVRAPRCYN